VNYKLIVYVPDAQLEAVKSALFAAGAGVLGGYAQCAWQVLGRGQFCPQAGSNPTLGERGRLEYVDEWRLEVLVPQARAAAVKRALLAAHPYEEPAFEFLPVVDI